MYVFLCGVSERLTFWYLLPTAATMVMPYLLQQVTSTEGMELVIVIISLFFVMYFVLCLLSCHINPSKSQLCQIAVLFNMPLLVGNIKEWVLKDLNWLLMYLQLLLMFHKGMRDNLMGESISLSEVTSMHPFKQKINLSNTTWKKFWLQCSSQMLVGNYPWWI